MYEQKYDCVVSYSITQVGVKKAVRVQYCTPETCKKYNEEFVLAQPPSHYLFKIFLYDY